MAKQRILVCPICGETQQETSTCCACQTALDGEGLLMAEGSIGPWWIRDKQHPFRPGMTYDHIAELAHKGEIERHTLVRGPTTRQLWTVARHVAGIAHLLGRCHRCDAHVDGIDRSCNACNAPFLVYRDRNNLGLDGSEPSKGAVIGLSSFLTDSSIQDTKSIPLRMPLSGNHHHTPAEDRIGSPQFRSVQRKLEQSKRTSRILVVALLISVIGLAIVAFLLFNR